MAVPPLVVSGTTIDSSWGNQVANALVNPFASTAARSSAITVPTAGMATYLTTNLATEGPEFYNSAGSWTKAWNLGWAKQAGSTTTTSVSTSGTTHTLLQTSASFTAVANRTYLVICNTTLNQSVGTDTFDVWLRLNSTAGSSVRHIRTSAVDQLGMSLMGEFTATGATTIVLTAQRAVGTGTLSTLNTLDHAFLIMDIGPAGAPS